MHDANNHFVSTSTTDNLPPRCVDGRPDPKSQHGPQMLGGSLHPIALRAVLGNTQLDFDKELVSKSLGALQKDFGIGVHRGSHQNKDQGKSDCGFADNLPTIFAKVGTAKSDIADRLTTIYTANQQVLDAFAKEQTITEPVTDLLAEAFDKITAYDVSKLSHTSEDLIQAAADSGANVESLQGEHEEQVAFVNLAESSTYDTNKGAGDNSQAFNLDLWAVMSQARSLGVDKGLALAASLILYVATEMVLVEDKGKPALPVIIHS